MTKQDAIRLLGLGIVAGILAILGAYFDVDLMWMLGAADLLGAITA